MKNNFQKGFTLIELIITVAIIGTLAAITVQQYIYYVAKAQVAAALAEISQAKRNIEAKLTVETVPNNSIGFIYSATRLAQWGIYYPVSSRCTYSITVNWETLTGVYCKLSGASHIDGKNISLTRMENSYYFTDGWICTSTVPEKYMPPGCVTNTGVPVGEDNTNPND
jgi:type IV pilus assembly protein PilA